MIACFRSKEEIRAMKHGRMLLEDSISLFDGKVNPIRCFSAREIKIATNNFNHRQVFHDSLYKLYRGSLHGQAVIVKRCPEEWMKEFSIRGVVVSSRLSVHKNALKLIGCCLETKILALVYESFDCEGTLYDELFRYSIGHDLQPSLPWKQRLKIAVDLSNLVAYLHTALRRPLIHRDIKPLNILLDKESGVIKLFNFELCTSLPEGKLVIEETKTLGTLGYVDPEYFSESRFNEKADVYGFGITLLNLLSGQHALLPGSSPMDLVIYARDCAVNERFEEILDPRLSADGLWPGKDRQFEAVLMLALECTRERGKMISCLRNEKERRAMKNGRRLLEESISLFDGKINPIRCFLAQEMKIATNNLDEKQVLGDWSYPLLYRGFLTLHCLGHSFTETSNRLTYF